MICPNCGEDNSSNFKFCGMCGTSLEERRPAGAPRVVTTPVVNNPEAARGGQSEAEPRTVASSIAAANRQVPPAAGPSFLGLNQPVTDGQDRNDSVASPFRDQSFFGSDSFFEPEEPKVGARRIVILLVLLVALGAGGWWAFSHYDKTRAVVSTNSQTSGTKPDGSETAANNTASSAKSSTEPSPSEPASPPPAAAAPQEQSKPPSSEIGRAS